MEINYQQEIFAPIDIVFSYLKDDEKMKLWMEGLENIEYPKGKNFDYPEGNEFIHTIKEGGHLQQYTGSVTKCTEPTLFAIELHNSAFQTNVTYELTAIGRKTQLDYHCEMEYASLFHRIMGSLFSGFTKRIVKSQMNDLKMLAEQEAVRRPTVEE